MELHFINLNNNMMHYLKGKDIYFTTEYGKACEYSDNAIWECCIYKDLIYVYLKKSYRFEATIYYDLITPYGYSGFYFEKEDTFKEFIILFREKAIKLNYITEVVRQNPYINIHITDYEAITFKTTFGVTLSHFNKLDDYLYITHKDNKRGFNIALKNELLFKMEDYTETHLSNFKVVYEQTLRHLNSDKYYYFNDAYYTVLGNIPNRILFANVYKDTLLIASYMIIRYDDLLHYHLGGSLLAYRHLRPNNFAHCKTIEYGIEHNYRLYHLGGGVTEKDTLHTFKNKIASATFNYTIYKNVLNRDIYDRITRTSPENDGHFPIHR
jgi:serine/alanine adding enzyme